jgi:serine/threonine-protein kinase
MLTAARRCAKCGQNYAEDVLSCPTHGTPLTNVDNTEAEDPYLGQCVAQQFDIQEFLGQGAMARVYRARQRGIEREVAIKILHKRFVDNQSIASRFQQEARVSGSLSHPNVVLVHAVGELETGPIFEGEPFMVLEFLDGISLSSALTEAGGALPVARALHIVLQICDALGEAHERGIVHRDLKPENVMLVRRGNDADFVKILDFGLAKQGAVSEIKTHEGAVLGTPCYISPEGARGEAVGAAGDVYAIATLLYECIAGRTPFDGANPVLILVKQTSEAAPDIRDNPLAKHLPEPLAALIARNLSKEPELRHPNAREFGRAVLQAARDSGLRPDELLPRPTLLGAQATLKLVSPPRAESLRDAPVVASALALQPTELLSALPASSFPPAAAVEQGKNAERLSVTPSESHTLRRLLLIVLCFVFGAGAALGIAKQFGAFEAPRAPLPAPGTSDVGGRG